jgi:hypothetical protein
MNDDLNLENEDLQNDELLDDEDIDDQDEDGNSEDIDNQDEDGNSGNSGTDSQESQLILGKYKTVEEAENDLKARQEALEKQELDSILALKKELSDTKDVLRQKTGMIDKSQIEIYEANQQINDEFFGREVKLLSKYFPIPADINSNEFASAYQSIVNDLAGSISKLTPQAAALFTAELLDLKTERDKAQSIVREKYINWIKANNESAKQSLSAFIGEQYKDQPEELKKDIESLFESTIAQYQEKGVEIDINMFQNDIKNISAMTQKAYNLGIEQGKKDIQLENSNNKQIKKLGGITGSDKENKPSGTIDSLEVYNKMSAKERARFIAG